MRARLARRRRARQVLSRRCDERGTGLVGSFFGAIVFLAFLALATHTLVSLYASSVITAVAWDDARRAADAPDDSVVLAAAESDARSRLTGFDEIKLQWLSDDQGAVGFTISAKRPMLLPRGLANRVGLDRIERTVWVREERLR